MDYRTENFRKKFNAAAQCLGVNPHEIISLKLRDTVNSHSEYRDFLQALEQQTGLRSSRVVGELQGEGHLLADGTSKIIVVEHESGLEVLYIAGSIASLVSLVPLVLQGWRAFRTRHRRRHDFDDERIEIRQIDQQGQFIENPVHADIGVGFMPVMNSAFMSAAKTVEGELVRLRQILAALTKRVEVLETQRLPARLSGEQATRSKSSERSPEAKDSIPRPSKKVSASLKELRALMEANDAATHHKERRRLENAIKKEFIKAFGLSPDAGKLTCRFFYRFINTDFAPREKLFDHEEFFRRGGNLVIVSQPYSPDTAELARWAKEYGATCTIANEWGYHYPGEASLFFVEFSPEAKDALDKRVREK